MAYFSRATLPMMANAPTANTGTNRRESRSHTRAATITAKPAKNRMAPLVVGLPLSAMQRQAGSAVMNQSGAP